MEGGETLLEEGGNKEKGSEGCNWRGKVENGKTGVIEKRGGERKRRTRRNKKKKYWREEEA